MKFAFLFAVMIVSASSYANGLHCKSAGTSDLKITFLSNKKIQVELVGEARALKGVFYGMQTSASETAYDKVEDYDLAGPRGSAKMKIKNEFMNFPVSCRNPRNCAGEAIKLPVKYTAELDYVGLNYYSCRQL